MPPFGNVALRKPNWDLLNPIVNRDVADVDRSDRDSGKAKYLSTRKLLMVEFATEEKLV